METYNLLPHQKELLRLLVKHYQDTEGEEYEYFVRAAVNGEVTISGSSESYYVGDKYSQADFEKLVSLGLLDRGRHELFYRVSSTSVEAVENDFEYPDPPVERQTSIINGTGFAIGPGAVVHLDQSHTRAEEDSQAEIEAARRNNRVVIIAAIITGIFGIIAALISRSPINPGGGQSVATVTSVITEEPTEEPSLTETAPTQSNTSVEPTLSYTIVSYTIVPSPTVTVTPTSTQEPHPLPINVDTVDDLAIRLLARHSGSPESRVIRNILFLPDSTEFTTVSWSDVFICNIHHITDADCEEIVISAEGKTNILDTVSTMDIDISSNGKYVASALSGLGFIWEPGKPESLKKLINLGGDTISVAWTPDNNSLLLGQAYDDAGKEGGLRRYGLPSGPLSLIVAPNEQHVGWVNDIEWSPTEDIFATVSADGTLKLWNLSGILETRVYNPNDLHYLNDLSWSPDGTEIVVVDQIGRVIIFDTIGNGSTLVTGDHIVVVDETNHCVLVEDPTITKDVHLELAYAVDWSSQNIIASGSNDNTILFWNANVDPPEAIGCIDMENNITALEFSEDGAFLVVGLSNGQVHLIYVATS